MQLVLITPPAPVPPPSLHARTARGSSAVPAPVSAAPLPAAAAAAVGGGAANDDVAAAVRREAATANALFAAGLQRLHLRKPGAGADALAGYVALLEPRYRRRVVLHTHHALAAELGLGGVHYREADRPPLPPLPPPPPPPRQREAAAVTNASGAADAAGPSSSAAPAAPVLTASTSFHALDELRRPWGPALSYCFLSPIYDSISKAGYGAAAFAPDELRAALAAAPAPVLALGGVTAARVPELRALGFAGVGVIGAVWQADDPLAALREFQEQLREGGGGGG